MAGFIVPMRDVEAILLSGGVRVFLDTSEINPPGVLIQPPAMRWRFHKGSADVDMELILVVPSNEGRRAIDQLSELVETVQGLLGDRAAAGQPAEVFLAEQSATVRAYALTYTDTVRQPSAPVRRSL